MDVPQSFQQHTQNPSRYVSVSNSSRSHNTDDHPDFPSPRYQPRTKFHHNPPHYTSSQSQSQSQSQSHFAFSTPTHDPDRSSFLRRSFSPAPKLSQRRMLLDDPFGLEVRAESRDQPRVLAENLQVRSMDFDSGVAPQKFQIGHNKPLPLFKSSSRLRHEPESSSRFRVEYGDPFEPKRGVEVLRGDGYYRRTNVVSSSGMSIREVEFVPNPPRNLESKPKIYDGRYEEEVFRSGRGDGSYDNQRRDYERKVRREVPASPYSSGEGTHYVSVKRDYGGQESGRYSRGSRGESHSYQVNRTPRKQFQKKSALLRIEKPNFRNAKDEKSSYYGYHQNLDSSSFRRRGQNAYEGSEIEEGREEGSPVQLDVSFKSNSLVAKAIVTPPRASDDADASLTPRDMKGIEGYVADRDCLIAELTSSVSTVDVGCPVQAVYSASTFDKEMIQSEEKVTSAEGMCDISMVTSLNVIDQPLETNEVRRSPDRADLKKDRVGSSKPSLKIAKKKRVVKKVVKKVVHPRSRVLKSKQKKHRDEPVTADFFVPTPSEDSGTHKNVASLSFPCPNEVEEPQTTRELEQRDTGLNLSTFVNVENDGNGLSTYLESTMQEEITTDNVIGYSPNSPKGLNTISDCKKDLTISHSSINFFPNNAHPIQSHQVGYRLSDMLLTEDNTDSVISKSGHTKMHENCSSVFDPANTTDTTLDTIDVAQLSKESFFQEEIPKETSRSSLAVDLSSSMETTRGVHSSHREENIISSNTTDVSVIKQLCIEPSGGLPETDATETYPDTCVSVGGDEENISIIWKKRTFRSQLDFSLSTNSNLDAPGVNPAIDTNASLNLSSKNPSCENAGSSLKSVDGGIRPGRDWSNISHDSSSCGISEANLIPGDADNSALYVTSPQCKRRKVSTSDLTQHNDGKSSDTSTFCLELPSTSIDPLVQQQLELPSSATHKLCAATKLMSCVNGTAYLHGNKLNEDSVVVDVHMQSKMEEVGVSVLGERGKAHDGTSLCTSGIQLPNTVEAFVCTGRGESGELLEKSDFPNFSNHLSLRNDRSEATSIHDLINFVPDSVTHIGSPQTLFEVSDAHMLDATSVSQVSNEICFDDQKMDQKPLDDSGSDALAQKSLPQCSKSHLVSDSESDQIVDPTNTSFAMQDSRSTSQGLNVTMVENNCQKNQLGHVISRAFPGHSSSQLASAKRRAPLTTANARTWHRNVSSSTASIPGSNAFQRTAPSQRQLPQRDGKFQSTSYVRKGNSLVRNPSPPAALSQCSGFNPVYRLNSAGLDESKKSLESENRVVVNLPGFRLGETKGSCEKPTTSLIQSGNKLPSSVSITLGNNTSSVQAGLLSNGCDGSNSDTLNSSETKLIEDLPASKDFDNRKGQLSNSDNQSEQSEGNLVSLKAKRIVYVKRKSNQLIATSNSVDLPVVNAGRSQPSSFDGYYKKRKNQLVRASLESHTRKPGFMCSKSGVQMTFNAASSLRLNKRRCLKVDPKTFKCSANSLVWTLCNTHSTKNGGLRNHQKVFPHLFPWKRTAYWRSLMNWNLFSKSSSSLAISRKLLLSRQRDTVYTRSINGFSLRKSKVLSVGGSSLKWSKSIERDSKKANEEATLAVAAVERKKREQKEAITSGSKNRNHSSRERIFRVGLFRYKMDPTRQTLQRISDESSSACAPSTNTTKDAKRSYIPKRLVIGKNEYVRIGNGNQLIRDPKKRARVLASEKVRWSLHTARLRLARKRKYCQFFTRFGRCNKDSGKCPFLHDPSKIAVCTKFLNGLCTNADCKLTHKVIPERMPDCSYFLQGLCTNKSCSYRHVNVNPTAPTCEGFLRGYCADGDECRKKHSYVCPAFEAAGTCPQGSKCKLHHPRNRIHGKKRKRSKELKNAKGRYFGSPDGSSVLESRSVTAEKCCAQDNIVDVFSEEACSDYIAIGSVDDMDENYDPRNTQTVFSDTDTSDLESDLDELMKPIRLMITTSLTT